MIKILLLWYEWWKNLWCVQLWIFLPLGNQYSKTKCKKWDEGSSNCYAEENSDISISNYCDWNYSWFNGTCIEYWNLNEDSNCAECKSELERKNNECLICNKGYYIALNYTKKLEKSRNRKLH